MKWGNGRESYGRALVEFLGRFVISTGPGFYPRVKTS